MGQRTRILILLSIKMRSVTSSALAPALALAVGGASAQVEVGGWEECPTPYEMGFGGDKIGYIIANTYDYAEQSPKCEAVPGQNGPDGAVDPNNFDTQNIVACDVQWSESPEYDCSLHKHAKNKWPCVDPGTCSKH